MKNSGLTHAHNSRRSFLKKSALATATLAVSDIDLVASSPFTDTNILAEVPWDKRITRWAQINITEKDPTHFDIAWWRNYWKKQGVIILMISLLLYHFR